MEPQFDTNEAARVAAAICQHTRNNLAGAKLRERIANQLSGLGLSTLRPHAGSLARDPARASNYYLAVDAGADGKTTPLLMHVDADLSSGGNLLAESLREDHVQVEGKEIVLSFIPFSSYDHETIRKFAEQVDRTFLPRPQRSQPAVAAGNRHPEISLPAVFSAYRTILDRLRVNMASTVQLSATREMTTEDVIAKRDGEDPVAIGHTRVSIRHLYHAGLWAAIRSGWREGYNAEADHFIVSGNSPEEIARSVEMVKIAIRHAAGYTKFTTDTSRLFELQADTRHPNPWGDSAVSEKFQQILTSEEQKWLRNEFSRPFELDGRKYIFSEREIFRLGVKFGQSLKLNEELYDYIIKAKSEARLETEFDFEPSIDEAETLTTAKELLFYMHWLKARGRAAQLCPPNLGFKKRQAYPVTMATSPANGVGLVDYCHHKMWPELPGRVEKEFGGKPLEELAARVAELADVARSFDTTLSIHSGSGKQPEVLERIGKSTAGRVNYKISGELQLQLFDVLRGQPASSRWRTLYERMVKRANNFAAAGAFGYESELAEKYVSMGREYNLGDASRGRVDGNLFLVFWLGNLVGSRDVDSPDGDHRFFKEKIDELPEDLMAEVQQHNSQYVVWLAEHLQG
ncbi:MAG TPA: tagaturonate epimerase family protein [Terriglobia bacterium]|nr:tagaturonate epimerase family protein [Terriglobia bacterium]